MKNKYLQYLGFLGILFLAGLLVFKTASTALTDTQFKSNLAYRLDYLNYYTGATILQIGKGEDLYDIDLQKTIMAETTPFNGIPTLLFRSFPVVALLFLPFSFLSYYVSYIVFFFFNIFLVYMLFFLLKRFTHIDSRLIVPIFFFFPLANSIFQGHPNLLFFFIVFFIYFFIKKEKYLYAGIVSAFIVLRIHFIILIPYFFLLAKDKKAYLRGIVPMGLLFFIVSVFLTKGLETIFYYPKFLIFTETAEFGSMPEFYVGLPSFLAKLGIVDNFSSYQVFAWNMAFYIIGLLVFWVLQGPKNKDAAFMSAILLSVVFSYHNYVHDLVILILPILQLFYVARDYYQKNKKIALDLIFVATILFSLPLLGFLNINFMSSLILIFIACYLFYASKRKSFTANEMLK